MMLLEHTQEAPLARAAHTVPQSTPELCNYYWQSKEQECAFTCATYCPYTNTQGKDKAQVNDTKQRAEEACRLLGKTPISKCLAFMSGSGSQLQLPVNAQVGGLLLSGSAQVVGFLPM